MRSGGDDGAFGRLDGRVASNTLGFTGVTRGRVSSREQLTLGGCLGSVWSRALFY